MKDLIKTLELALDEQRFVTLDKETTVSIVLEHSYWYTDDKGKIHLSNNPTGHKLNIAIQKGNEYVKYLNINSEEEFYLFMKKLKNDEIKYTEI